MPSTAQTTLPPHDGAAETEILAKAIEGGDPVTLAMVLVQLTGDGELLEEIRPHVHGPWDYLAEVPDELQRRIRDRLAAVVKRTDLRDPAALPLPPDDLLKRMMDVSVGGEVPEEYVSMMRPLLALETDDRREAQPEAKAQAGRLGVLVIGAGVSGLAAAYKLKHQGIPFTILEKNPTVGGTWYENSYPGCGVDTPNHFYSFSFEPNHDWSHYFSKGEEIQGYLESVADRHDLRKHVRFGIEVLSAVYDDEKAEWKVTARPVDGGAEEVLTTKILVSAVGQLNRPAIPDIPGLDRFAGPVFHTARWDHFQALQGKRVAMIGTGASGMQVGPAIAGDVDRLVIFQRTPHWVTTNPNYHRTVSEDKKLALKHLPFYANWYRFQLAWASADGIHPTLRLDPAWPKPGQSLNAANERTREFLTNYIRSEVGDDPELLRKVLPSYPPYGKRMLRDSHWYETLRRENVDLVSDGIREITGDAVISNTGEAYPVDLIVLATRFRAGEMLAPMEIRGREGTSLHEQWADDDPRAYLGMCVPDFPNMFVMFGPNTNYAHGGSAIFSAEGQAEYITRALEEMERSGATEIRCRTEVYTDYNIRTDAEHAQMVWGQPNVKSWYKNKKGRVFSVSPWRMFDHWKWSSNFDKDDFHWRKA